MTITPPSNTPPTATRATIDTPAGWLELHRYSFGWAVIAEGETIGGVRIGNHGSGVRASRVAKILRAWREAQQGSLF